MSRVSQLTMGPPLPPHAKSTRRHSGVDSGGRGRRGGGRAGGRAARGSPRRGACGCTNAAGAGAPPLSPHAVRHHLSCRLACRLPPVAHPHGHALMHRLQHFTHPTTREGLVSPPRETSPGNGEQRGGCLIARVPPSPLSCTALHRYSALPYRPPTFPYLNICVLNPPHPSFF